jgi:hypothetical protein
MKRTNEILVDVETFNLSGHKMSNMRKGTSGD